MDCEEVRDLLSPYLDRELTSEEMTAIAGHLENCPDCMEQSTVFGQLSRVIKHWEGIRASEGAKIKLLEQVRRSSPRSGGGRTPPLLLLGILAGALFLGGAAALLVWTLRGAGARRSDSPATARCVQTAGRVEVVQDGAPVQVRGSRDLRPGQELCCNLGGAAQVELLSGEGTGLKMVLRGPASLRLNAGLPDLVAGTLVVHAPGGKSASSPGLPMKAGRWTVVLRGGGEKTVGLIELGADGGLRVAVLEGGIRIGVEGPWVQAGQEMRLGPGGALGAPQELPDREVFGLLVGGVGGG